MFIQVPSRAFAAFVAIAFQCAAVPAARAQDASPWIVDAHSSVRLLAGSRSGGVLLGGIGFQLAAGWKTYWRTPGDSGVPPRFDFSKSENVEAVTVLWPAPVKFDDGSGGKSFGYKNQVILPLRIVTKNADKPVILRADIHYAVCEKLCLPVEANAELAFESVASTQDSALTTALENVPKPANIGDPNSLTIRDVKRIGNTVQVDVVSNDSKAIELFVEGPTPDWALPAPRLLPQSPASQVRRFTFELEGLPPGATPDGAALKLTLVGDFAYEFNINLN